MANLPQARTVSCPQWQCLCPATNLTQPNMQKRARSTLRLSRISGIRRSRSTFNTGETRLWTLANLLYSVSGCSSFISAIAHATTASEDCLSLAIWTPANATSSSDLPVALFWTGGGYQTNGILVPGQLPPHWVSLSQKYVIFTRLIEAFANGISGTLW
jgi:hypothetical protein